MSVKGFVSLLKAGLKAAKMQSSCKHSSKSTEFRALATFEKVVRGEMSYKEYCRLGKNDLSNIVTCLDCGEQF